MKPGGKWSKVPLVLAVLALVAALPAVSSAKAPAARAGRLDPAFGKDGKAVTVLPAEESTREYVDYALPFEFAPGRVVMAAAGGDRVVVANGKAIVEYLANGQRNPRFGGNGAVPVAAVEGSRFQLADIAVDSQGRVLIAGTTRPKTRLGMAGLPLPGPIPSMATIVRYQPNGQLDRSFGSEGVVNTDLGVQPPTFEGRAYPGSAVAVVGLLVDRSDRPILTGSAVSEVGRCAVSQNRYEASRAIVARRTSSGAADSTFAENGLKSVGGISWLGSPAFTSTAIVSTGANVDPCPQGGPDDPSVLASFGSDGALDASFDADGFWSRPFTRISSLAVAPSGKLVLLARTIELSHGKWIESAGEAERLLANGSFDASFGHGGRASLDLPKRGAVSAVAADAKDRVLLVGQVWSKSRRKPRRNPLRSNLLLMRMTKAGELDRDFGRRGRVTTGFGNKTKLRATDVLLDRGRIVVGAKIVGPKIRNGFALARYLGGR